MYEHVTKVNGEWVVNWGLSEQQAKDECKRLGGFARKSVQPIYTVTVWEEEKTIPQEMWLQACKG